MFFCGLQVPSLLKEIPPEPLQINISSLLPEISPNYKPVAFPLDSQPKRFLTPDEALSQAISNKNIRYYFSYTDTLNIYLIHVFVNSS